MLKPSLVDFMRNSTFPVVVLFSLENSNEYTMIESNLTSISGFFIGRLKEIW